MDLDKNLELYFKKLEELGLSTDSLKETYGEKIKVASFTLSSEHGLAFEGSLLYILLFKLTPYAIKLNELYPAEIRVDKNQLIKVCLLHQIAKAIRITPNDNDWEIRNRKLLFKYTEGMPAIRTGLHSLSMCFNCGIQFTDDEVEAMTVNDREMTDMQSRFHSNMMSNIIRQASEMVYIEYAEYRRGYDS